MIAEQQFLREYAYAQNGNYTKHQVIKSQPAVDKFAPFPMKNINPRLASWSCINPRLVSGGSCNKLDDKQKLRQDVSAFGPKHAEHARRLYQEAGRSVVLFPACRLTYDPVGVSYNDLSQADRGELEQPAFGGTVNNRTFFNHSATSRVPVNVASHPRETVLKVARISSRPKVKSQDKLKTELAFGKMKRRKRSNDSLNNKSIDFQGKKNLSRELSKAPIFQILCEISNTK